ncbi:MAG: competence/damage-inducible protein A [Anaerohalosphaeraceae bacterium]|nr:competence/damage-inducible protein A [Anaerohalosphaeraceae bacterium]
MAKKASIISIGNELLNGQTVDSNSAWLCGELVSMGIAAESVYIVGDDVELIADRLVKASAEADIILLTGGLGPTDDDITRNAIAAFLNCELVLREEIVAKMERYFELLGYAMPRKNVVQALLPKKALPIDNGLGTAPGILYEDGKKILAAMPGVPSEMKRMFSETVSGEIKKISSDEYIVIKKIRCTGIGESTVAEMLGDLMERNRNPLINCTVDAGVITLHIVSKGKSREKAVEMAGRDEEKLIEILGELAFGTGEQNLADVVAEKLISTNQTLAIAESCSGGLIAKMITDVSGASRFFNYGWVTYADEAKITQLKVNKEIIEKYGAVSAEVASTMADGARAVSGADWAIAVTGIAGPGGGNEQKPVGLVYISIASKNGTETKEFNFRRNNRDFIRTRTAQTSLNLLRLRLSASSG